jgi:outer membrane protein
MKKIKYSISGVFALAVVMLLFAQCKDKGTNTSGELGETSEVPILYLPVAYVDVDSLLINFDFYNKLVSAYEDKLSKQTASLNANYEKLQNEVIAFEQKARNNVFISQERMTQEHTRIQRMQQDIEKKAEQMQQELGLEQRLIQQQLTDSLTLGIKEFNTPQKYQMIFTKTGNSTILYADPQYNITNDVIVFLNKRFKTE